jgi:hypothetical protein
MPEPNITYLPRRTMKNNVELKTPEGKTITANGHEVCAVREISPDVTQIEWVHGEAKVQGASMDIARALGFPTTPLTIYGTDLSVFPNLGMLQWFTDGESGSTLSTPRGVEKVAETYSDIRSRVQSGAESEQFDRFLKGERVEVAL